MWSTATRLPYVFVRSTAFTASTSGMTRTVRAGRAQGRHAPCRPRAANLSFQVSGPLSRVELRGLEPLTPTLPARLDPAGQVGAEAKAQVRALWAQSATSGS